MAGDWIKMRDNLWDDPRVTRICDLCDCGEAQAIGALYWLWATADQHTEDGILPGLSLRQIDRKTGVQGFAQAMCEIGWLADHPEGVRLIRFDEHNGSSAKRRSLDAQRKANVRKPSASDADNERTKTGQRVELEEEEEEEKRRDKTQSPDEGEERTPTVVAPAAVVCRALRKAGMPAVNPSHPTLLALLEAGATEAEFLDAMPKSLGKRDAFEYLLGVVKGRRQDAAELAKTVHRGAMPKDRKATQLETAALMTGAKRAKETIDVPSRVIPA